MTDEARQHTQSQEPATEPSDPQARADRAAASLPVLSLRHELKTWLGLARAAATVGLVLGAIFLLLEIIRAFLTLHELNAYLGYAFIGLLAGVGLWAWVRLRSAFLEFPPVLIPPDVIEPKSATVSELYGYTDYLAAFTDRLSQNSLIEAGKQATLAEVSRTLAGLSRRRPKREELLTEIELAEGEITPVLDRIDSLAQQQVSTCVRDVMLGVTLSPFRSADLAIVLYRNGRMILGIAHLYNSRPRLQEQLRVLADVGSVVATVQILNFGEKFIEQLGEGIPGIGSIAGDVAQGVGAGLMTSVAGGSAIQRCRAYRGWNKVEAQATIRSRSREFFRSVKDIYRDDVAPSLRTLSGVVLEKVVDALDTAWRNMGEFVVEPVVRSGNAAAKSTGRHGAQAWAKAKDVATSGWTVAASMKEPLTRVGSAVVRETEEHGAVVWEKAKDAATSGWTAAASMKEPLTRVGSAVAKEAGEHGAVAWEKTKVGSSRVWSALVVGSKRATRAAAAVVRGASRWRRSADADTAGVAEPEKHARRRKRKRPPQIQPATKNPEDVGSQETTTPTGSEGGSDPDAHT